MATYLVTCVEERRVYTDRYGGGISEVASARWFTPDEIDPPTFLEPMCEAGPRGRTLITILGPDGHDDERIRSWFRHLGYHDGVEYPGVDDIRVWRFMWDEDQTGYTVRRLHLEEVA